MSTPTTKAGRTLERIVRNHDRQSTSGEHLFDEHCPMCVATPDTGELDGLVCSLCLFVGDSEDPTPITILNGNLTCEPHNGYFQGGDNTQAIIAWKREHPRGDSDTR